MYKGVINKSATFYKFSFTRVVFSNLFCKFSSLTTTPPNFLVIAYKCPNTDSSSCTTGATFSGGFKKNLINLREIYGMHASIRYGGLMNRRGVSVWYTGNFINFSEFHGGTASARKV